MPKVDFDGFIAIKRAQLDALKETSIVKRYLALETYITDMEKLKETILAEGDRIPEVKERKERTPRHRAKMPDVGNGRIRMGITESIPAADLEPILEASN